MNEKHEQTHAIEFVGGMLGDSLGGITGPGLRALEAAEAVIYPGDWIGTALQASFGSRLHFGRALTATDVLEIVGSNEHTAILYAGDPMLFTGRPGEFPTSRALAGAARSAGYQVNCFAGCSSLQAALVLLGMHIGTGPKSALTIAAPLCRPDEGAKELRALAKTHATLALLWTEDRALEARAILCATRGDACPVHIVRHAGGPRPEIIHGTLGTLEAAFAVLKPPAVILVQGDVPLRGEDDDALKL